MDDKYFNIDKGLIIEFRAALHVAPTLDGNVYFGVQNDSYGADSQRIFTADEVAKLVPAEGRAKGFYALFLCVSFHGLDNLERFGRLGQVAA